jgi:hypothetical protein
MELAVLRVYPTRIQLCVTLGNNPRKMCGMTGLRGLQAHEELRP